MQISGYGVQRNRRSGWRRVVFAALLLTVITAMPAALAALPMSLNDGEVPTLAPMLEQASPAIVNISTRGRVQVQNPLMDHPFFEDPFFRRFFGQPDGEPRYRETQSLGSGVIIDARKGYIITNAHVIQGAEEIKVMLIDEREFTAEVIGADEETDIAVIKISPDKLTELPLGDSDNIRVGDFVVAIGNPFGLRHTVTSGIVSALGRSGIGDADSFQDYIQTDASINPGNSGGALVNLKGELIGVNSAILSRSGGNIGIGFAVPVNIALQVKQQLIEFGEVKRGRLGVIVQNLTPDLAEAFGLDSTDGVVVAQVEPGSSAEKAGLKPEDVIVRVNDKPVRNYRDLRNTIGLLRVGDKLDLQVLRNGKPMKVSTRVGEAPAAGAVAAADLHPKLIGAEFGNAEGQDGVVVKQLEPGSPAATAGLRPGDLISAVNRASVKDLQAFKKAVKGEDSLLLTIQRGRAALFLVIK